MPKRILTLALCLSIWSCTGEKVVQQTEEAPSSSIYQYRGLRTGVTKKEILAQLAAMEGGQNVHCTSHPYRQRTTCVAEKVLVPEDSTPMKISIDVFDQEDRVAEINFERCLPPNVDEYTWMQAVAEQWERAETRTPGAEGKSIDDYFAARGAWVSLGKGNKDLVFAKVHNPLWRSITDPRCGMLITLTDTYAAAGVGKRRPESELPDSLRFEP